MTLIFNFKFIFLLIKLIVTLAKLTKKYDLIIWTFVTLYFFNTIMSFLFLPVGVQQMLL